VSQTYPLGVIPLVDRSETSGTGWRCPLCQAWIGPGDIHKCQAKPPMTPGKIAAELRRLAEVLEALEQQP